MIETAHFVDQPLVSGSTHMVTQHNHVHVCVYPSVIAIVIFRDYPKAVACCEGLRMRKV